MSNDQLAGGRTGIIDAHVHTGNNVTAWRSDDAVADLAGCARRVGIERLLVSVLGVDGYLAAPGDTELRRANALAEQVVASDPIFAGQVYTSPDHVEASLELMEKLIANGPFVGIKLWIAQQASAPGCDPIVDYAAELGVPVLQHAWYKTTGQLSGESHPGHVAEMARRHPNAIIQMAHLYGAGERGVLDVVPYENVVIDTCGCEPEAGLLEFALNVLGPDRVLYGSDAPGRDFAVQLSKINNADLSDDVRNKVLFGNARRLYRRLES
ncbi:amidohydrolase family protein [Propionibacteriaceae bacterium Y1700]|uniref:amidohydrolase family protein n=1 Tax=Microlunatus sp. Y1700 TaxID=3418487 RepID=UPI003DA78B25